jgi:hypothetical protein
MCREKLMVAEEINQIKGNLDTLQDWLGDRRFNALICDSFAELQELIASFTVLAQEQSDERE